MATNTRTFEVKFSMDTGVEHSYSSIPREEFVYLEEYCTEKRLNIENEMDNEDQSARFADDIGDDSDDSDAGPRKRTRVEVDFRGAGGDDEDESSVDEDFQIKSKDVPSDVSSEASSDDSDAVAEEMDTTDIKEVGESDSDVEVANASKPKAPKASKSKSSPPGGTKKKKDPNAPKRPLSSFMFFSKAKRQEVIDNNEGLAFGEIGKELGRLWKEASATEKEEYEEMSTKDKERYKKDLESYVPPESGDDLPPQKKKTKVSTSPKDLESLSSKKKEKVAEKAAAKSKEFISSSDDE